MNSRCDEEEIDSMARTRPERRRKANARARLNLEIVGITALAFAVLCGVALAFPHAAGAIGGWTASLLRRLFGTAAPLFPVLVALVGAIVFLEVNVPRMIAGLGSAALAYFLIINAMLGARGPTHGGIVGSNIWWALRALVGGAGAWILLIVAALSLTLWLTNASMKQLIGRVIVFFGGLRPPPMPNRPSWKNARSPFENPLANRRRPSCFDRFRTAPLRVIRSPIAFPICRCSTCRRARSWTNPIERTFLKTRSPVSASVRKWCTSSAVLRSRATSSNPNAVSRFRGSHPWPMISPSHWRRPACASRRRFPENPRSE